MLSKSSKPFAEKVALFAAQNDFIARMPNSRVVCMTSKGHLYFITENLLLEIGQLKNLNPTERVHLEQVNITRHKNIGFCRNRQLQKFIVLRVSAFCDRCGHIYQNN